MGSVLILLTMEKCTQTVGSEKDGHEQRMGKRRDLNKRGKCVRRYWVVQVYLALTMGSLDKCSEPASLFWTFVAMC